MDRRDRRQSERRRDLRYPFTAAVEAVEPKSQTKLNARTSDISLGGCYVDTINPFPVSSVIKIRLIKDGVTFEADAKVVLSQNGMGMGVNFISKEPQQGRIIQTWLYQLSGETISEVPTPGLDVAESKEQDLVGEMPRNTPDHVLAELLNALMSKGILTDEEGSAMLQKLDRTRDGS